MIEILVVAILIALGINTILLIPYYHQLLNWFKINKKPLNCSFCLGFWICILIGAFPILLTPIGLTTAQMMIVTMITPYLSALFEKAFKAIPITI